MSSTEAEALILNGLSRIRIPLMPTDRVYKDECVYSFDTPETETGLFVCLNSFWGMGRDYVEAYSSRTGNSIFLNIYRIKRKIPVGQTNDGPEKKVTRLAIGVEGGFDAGNATHEYETTEHHSIYLMPGFIKIDLPNEKLPEELLRSVEGVLKAESATKLAELETMAATWDGEERRVSKHASDLQQLDNGKKIPPQGWRCEVEGCNKTDNLWLNLTNGAILCGRRYADGSGGNNHAVEHFNTTGYPLAVKLGTITPDGRADVYSYDEDDMVENPNLVKHLAHFGINVAVMEKTDKSMAEMEIDINQKFGEWSAIQESGGKLKPLRGPGLTGLINLGNTCYLNSIMQVLVSIPEFQNRFMKSSRKYFETAVDPVNDFNVQMSKLFVGLLSGNYSKKMESEEETETDSQVGVSPSMFRTLVGKGHPEFSTKKQQDAQEYFLHFINVLERQSRNEPSPADCFKFQVEDKIVCDSSKMVRYASRVEYCLPLPIPLEAALNKAEVEAFAKKQEEAEASGTIMYNPVEERIRPKIPIEACLENFIAKETLDLFHSSATQTVGTASKFTRLETFPNYLVIQLKKFMMGSDWQPKKLDVLVDMPLELDLTSLRAKGVQPGEVELPHDQAKPKAPAVNEEIVSQLTEMGFNPNACRRAVISTGNATADIAMNWLMEHMDDQDINDPVNCGTSVPVIADPANVMTIQSMGFSAEQATRALQATDNNVQRALDWIFSHTDELNSPNPGNSDNANNAECENHLRSQNSGVTDGPGLYKLMGFVSHMGTSSQVGHYVCHIQKESGWAIFNDNKVAASENLPKDLGYLYFYKRA